MTFRHLWPCLIYSLLAVSGPHSALMADELPAAAAGTNALNATGSQTQKFPDATARVIASAWQTAPPNLSPQLSPTQPEWFGYSSPVRVSIFGGENYAEPDAFASFDILKPLHDWQFSDGSEQLQYLDARAGISFESGGLLNLGIGRRHYFAGSDVILDGNLWYDIDGTRDRTFHQVTAGGQVQNNRFLLRGHYYLPIFDDDDVVGYTKLTGNTAYQGNILALERFRRESQAFRGFDAEIGVTLPTDELIQALVGYYSFEADDAETISGVTTSVVAQIWDSLFLALQLTLDEDSDETVLATLTYSIDSRDRRRPNSIRHRLGEAARRNRHIVSRETRVYDPVAALDASGNQINIIHASSAGTGGGTFESPHTSLFQAAGDAVATPNSIILAHADSVFDSQSIQLPAQTRFLGEGISHTVQTSQLGTVVLPRATSGTILPTIRNSPAASAAIGLAAQVEVSGLRMENAGGTGVLADGLAGDFALRHTTIDGAATGIHIRNSGGAQEFESLVVSNTTGDGFLLEGSSAASAVTFTTSLSIQNAGADGLQIDTAGAGASITFDGTVDINGSGGHGISLTENSPTSIVTFNNTTTVDTTGGNGVMIASPTAPTTGGVVNFVGDLDIQNTSGSGLVVQQSDADVQVQNVSVAGWGQNAILLDRMSGTFTLANPLTLQNTAGTTGSMILITGSTGSITFPRVTITDTAAAAGSDAVVRLTENNTVLNKITFADLNVSSVNRTAFEATESGSNISQLLINDGVLSSVGATALLVDGLSSDVSLTSVSASGTAVGAELRNMGPRTAFHSRFRIVGDGVTAGSGGTMTGVQQGVRIVGSEDVSLNLMNIDSTVTGVSVSEVGFNQAEHTTLNQLQLTDAGGSANWVGIDVSWGQGAHFSDANLFTNNVITGSGSGQTGLRIINDRSNPEMQATIGGNSINLTGAGSNGISLSVNGVLPTQTTNFGGINLTTSLNNIVNTTASPFITSEANGATVTGSTLVNGIAVP
ncbi:MAG: hypothetical protein RIK87_27295 [Fuerstiella sp.]